MDYMLKFAKSTAYAKGKAVLVTSRRRRRRRRGMLLKTWVGVSNAVT
jgi:hypothetical protein